MFGIRKGLKQQMRRIIGQNPPTPAPTPVPAPAPVAAAPSPPVPAPTPAPTRPPAPAPVAAAPAPAPVPAPAPARPAPSGIAAMIAAGAGEEDETDIDLSVSYTSGPAAVAAAAAMAARDMVGTAADGTPYWGPLDNESARARAAGHTLVIDQHECIQCGTCVENTEQVFILPDDAKAVVIRQEGPMELIQDAIDACPVTCIHWTDAPDQYEQVNDAEGRAL